MHPLIGLRYRTEIDGWKVGELLTWVVRNMDYVVIPRDVNHDGVLSFSNAVHWLCKSLDKSCIKAIHEYFKGNTDHTTRPVKSIYAVGHGTFMFIDVNVKVNEDGVYPKASVMTYLLLDPYGKIEQSQKELLRLIGRAPDSVKPA